MVHSGIPPALQQQFLLQQNSMNSTGMGNVSKLQIICAGLYFFFGGVGVSYQD